LNQSFEANHVAPVASIHVLVVNPIPMSIYDFELVSYGEFDHSGISETALYQSRSSAVSEARLANTGSIDDEITDESAQREWDRFAIPDHSGDDDSSIPPIAVPARMTKATLARWTINSFLAYDSTTALATPSPMPNQLTASTIMPMIPAIAERSNDRHR
jgi:hypothetical protein